MSQASKRNRNSSPAAKAKATTPPKAVPSPVPAAAAKPATPSFDLLSFGDACLRGASQVVFVDNPRSGVLIIVALAIANKQVAVHGVIGLCMSTLAAALAFGPESTTHGLMGYNGMLAGLTFATFPAAAREKDGLVFGLDDRLVALLAMTTVVNTVASRMMKGPSFTLAFTICAVGYMAGPLAAVYVAGGFALTHGAALAFRKFKSIGNLAVVVATVTLAFWYQHMDQVFQKNTLTIGEHFSSASLHGVSQIFLAENWISALLILAAIAFSSPLNAFLAAFGSIVGVMVSVMQNTSGEAVSSGLHGYGPALAAMAVGGGIFTKATKEAFCWAAIAATLAGLVQTVVAQVFQMYSIASPAFGIAPNVSIMLVLAVSSGH